MKNKEQGLTIIELLIAIGIMAVLSLIAMPMFQNYSLKAHRVEARNTLQAAATKLGQVYFANKRYDAIGKFEIDSSTGKEKFVKTKEINDDWLAENSLNKSPATGSVRYEISITLDADTVRTIGDETVNFGAQGYTLTATATGKQEKDKCKIITFNSRGVKGGTMPNECWR